ncbi:MAG: hypothetical protein ACRDGH_11670, partial [Candidatus Limnocylindria bacterium]
PGACDRAPIGCPRPNLSRPPEVDRWTLRGTPSATTSPRFNGLAVFAVVLLLVPVYIGLMFGTCVAAVNLSS